MGVSAQQHRVVTGCFSTNLGSSAGSTSLSASGWPGKGRKRKKTSKHGAESWRSSSYSMWSPFLLLLVTVFVNTSLMVVLPPLLLSTLQSVVQTGQSSGSSAWQSACCMQELEVTAKATWQVVIDLQLAGDVESNSGPAGTRVTRSNPPGDDRLNEGKAMIIQQAPLGIRLVLSLWEPGKSVMRQCMDKLFLVPALKESLGWLWSLPVSDKSIAKMNKQLVIENIILRFEALLPATCGTCQQEYCVKKDDPVPSLACHGCAQGFHQGSLETLLGGLTVFPTLPGVTYWLCPLCSSTYSPPLTTLGGLD